MEHRNRASKYVLVFAIVVIGTLVFLGSCSLFSHTLYIELVNDSTHDLDSVTLKTGYQDVGGTAQYTDSLLVAQTLSAGSTMVVDELVVPKDGTGDLEAVRIEIVLDNVTYHGEDNFLYYNDQGGNRDVTITISDATPSGLSVDVDTWN